MDNKKTVILPESVVPSLLNEREWNYHFSRGKEHDGRPYVSDNKFRMSGRDTGHFGSGTYFATYKDDESLAELGGGDGDGRFIKIADNVYRVDMDFYKNLYRVWGKTQGDVLYTLLKDMNRFYNRIINNSYYSNADLYQRMMRNCDSLGLKLPSYYELTRMAQRHEGTQSFSTVFMEHNGFNGVNVSGVEYYDNTTHGSVIYDLSKIDGDAVQEVPSGLWRLDRSHPYDNAVVYDSIGDYEAIALNGSSSFWWDQLDSLPPSRVKRILRNYASQGNVLEYFQIERLSDDIRKWYLRMIFNTNPSDRWGHTAIEDMMKKTDRFGSLIADNDAWYYANYHGKSALSHASGFKVLLAWFSWELDWNLSEEEEREEKRKFAQKLMQNMTRPLTKEEEEYLEEWLEVDD